MKNLLWAVVLLVVLAGGYWFIREGGTRAPQKSDMGSYAYTCENGSQFTMSPSPDMRSIKLSAGAQGMFTGDVNLLQATSTAGARYESGNIVFIGAGEGVQLSVGSESTVCNPVPSTEMAPWNWGDAGEGGGVKQDVRLIVSESIVGKWQSTEDPKFVREFKGDGTVADWYEGKVQSRGTFQVFTKGFPIEVAFPLQEGTTYIQLTMQGTQAEKLNFKVNTLTPEELELTYMDRGGVLKFKAVK